MKKLLFPLMILALLGVRPALAEDCSNINAKVQLQEASQAQTARNLATQLKAELSWAHLKSAFSRIKKQVRDVELQELNHDGESYKIQLVANQWIFWDQLQLQVDFPAENKLRIRVLDNWVPTAMILEKIKSKLQGPAGELPLTITQTADALEVVLESKDISLEQQQIVFNRPELFGQIAKDGSLTIKFANGTMQGKPSGIALTHGNELQLSTGLCGSPDQAMDGALNLLLGIDLNPEFLKPITLSGEKLSERLQAASGLIGFKGKGRLNLDPLTLTAEGDLGLQFDQLEIENKNYSQVKSVPFKWKYSFPDQLEIYPDLPAAKPLVPELTANHLTLFPDGPAYYDEIMQTLATARESIMQEVFSLHEGQTTRALVRLLTLKAIGWSETDRGLEADPATPDGVRVYLLHNHELKAKGAQEIKGFFERTADQVFSELTGFSREEKEKLSERLRQNLRISALIDGPALADHRKLLVIDGQIGYTGGRNWGDSYFTADSFHDLMIKVQGPGVRKMQQAFITNWEALNPDNRPYWYLKPEAELAAALPAAAPLSRSTVLTTSHRAWEIESALLETINQAKNVIRIEHAYIYHEPIEAALRAAKARGVEIRLLFSERSDESVFERINPATALKLIQAPGPGKVSCWLYQGRGGKDDYMVHSKYLSVDGRIAIAGSANLIPRSLHSPFTAAGVPLLFNEEIVLYIDDPAFVGQLD
ncbi:MAG: phosphatidylserine/phosphatidylglycerophosphate/cardiolipin synthase family protein, partial [Candidatus Sericytochromatia bacterium]